MGKKLYLARHAKSSWKDLSLHDFDRPLNSRGEKDAPMMAQILAQKNLQIDILLSSPALRAKKTAEIYAKALGIEPIFDEAIYDASAQSLYYLLMEYFTSHDKVMVVGHNPAITELNNILSNEPIYNVPTAAVIAITFEGNMEPGEGVQTMYEFPKKYTQE